MEVRKAGWMEEWVAGRMEGRIGGMLGELKAGGKIEGGADECIEG
jgi:hypothetical protein